MRPAKTLVVGNAAKVCGQVAQGCKPYHSVPPFQGRQRHRRRWTAVGLVTPSPPFLRFRASTVSLHRMELPLVFGVGQFTNRNSL